MVDPVIVFRHRICDLAHRGQICNVVHQKIRNAVHQYRIPDFILLSDIANDQRIKYILDIVISLFLLTVYIGTGQTAIFYIPVECFVHIFKLIIFHILFKRKREYLYLICSSGKQSRKVTA